MTIAPAQRNGHVARPKRNRLGWWSVLCVFIDERLRDVSPLAGCVWAVLFRNSHEGVARISIARLATVCGMSKRSINKATKELVNAGLLKVELHGGRNVGPNRYRLFNMRSGVREMGDSTGAAECAPSSAAECAHSMRSTPDAACASPALRIGGDE